MTLVGRTGFVRSVVANAVLDDDVHSMDGCLGLGRTVALCEGQAMPGNVRVRSAQIELAAVWDGHAEATTSIGSLRGGWKLAQL
jgi:hypothetical protein